MIDSRKIVYESLDFQNPSRVARQVWDTPWTYDHFGSEIKKLKEIYPEDITWAPSLLKKPLRVKGNAYEIGEYLDEWGCTFLNKQKGIMGEVKEPLIKDEDWADSDRIRLPKELLCLDKEKINAFCRNADKYILAGSSVRIFERLQFLRGTEELLMDLAIKPDGLFKTIARIHDFFCEELEAWAKTDVDALFIQDDWGTQLSLLINPDTWVEIFKPLYRDYVEIAHRMGKKMFIHSDGNILSILPHLIEIGVDALNSQIFCMGLEQLAEYKGKITFWGEIDRQRLLTVGTTKDIEEAVNRVKNNLWQNGGCIAQCDFGLGSKPENVFKVFETWNKII